MKICLWIFICGLLHQLKYTASNSTVTDPSILNLVLESSTTANFDKQVKTNTLNSSDLFSSNNVNTGPLYSSSTNEECKNGDCTSHLHTSPSTDNSSSASKILWNLVNTIKSTTAQPLISDEMDFGEESTVPSLNTVANSHFYNHSNVHNSSYYFNDNELDAEINSVNDFSRVHPTPLDEVISSTSSSEHPTHNFENVTTSSESSAAATESLVNEYNLGENDTVVWESTEQIASFIDNATGVLNITDYTTPSSIQETTISMEDELDFTTYILDSSQTYNVNNMEEFDKEITNPSKEPSLETPHSPTDTAVSSEYNDSSIALSINYDTSTESVDLKSKDPDHPTSNSMSNIPFILENKENSTSFYLDYDTSLEAEEMKSEDIFTTNTTDSEENKQSSASVFDASTDTVLWEISRETHNSTLPSLSNDTATTAELHNDPDSDATSVTLSSEKQGTYLDDIPHNETEISENRDSTASLTTSIESAEEIDYILNFTQETQPTTEPDGAQSFNESSDASKQITEKSLSDIPTIANMESTIAPNLTVSETRDDSEMSETKILSTPEDFTGPNNSTEIISDRFDILESHDLYRSEVKQNASLFTSSRDTNDEDEIKMSTNSTVEYSDTANTDPNINIVYLNTIQGTSTEASLYSNNLNEINNNVSLAQTDDDTVPSGSKTEETSTVFLDFDSSITVLPSKETNFETEANIADHTPNVLTSSSSETEVTTSYKHSSDSKFEETSTMLPISNDSAIVVLPTEETHFETEISDENQTPDNLNDSLTTEINVDHKHPDEMFTSTEIPKNETHTSVQGLDIILTQSEKETESTTSNVDELTTHTEHVSLGINIENTDQVITDKPEFFTHSPTESILTSDHFSTATSKIMYYSDDLKHTTKEMISPEIYQTESSIQRASSEKTTIEQVNFSESGVVTGANTFDDTSTTHEMETITTTTITTPTFSEISSLSVTETYREGKHIPFSSTLLRTTTQYPKIFNDTDRTYSHLPQPKTTENNFVNLLYNQIKAEELTPEERSNLINAVIKLPEKYYNKEEINEKIAIIHLWLLHAVADEYKNATLSSSGSDNDSQLDEIEFENLPQILYVLPTPEVYLPNISFTFVVHNKWRNETFPVDIILTILNLHTENLKHLVEIEEIHFSHGLLVQSHDLLTVIIEKYGIILLATCLITVAMILLLVCVVVYYRRKTRHSAHCLTDDKLHRNMQEAMGIDLNPAVIILQDEIKEKAALNGNKICSLDDDEGWLAPIGDVPVEDNSAPFVQDTKL